MKYLKKVLICIMILMIIISSNQCIYAANTGGMVTNNIRDTQESISNNNDGDNKKSSSRDSVDDLIGSAVDGIVGLLLYPFRLVIVIIGTIARNITGTIAALGGFDGEASVGDTLFISADDILFNRIPLTDIDFFDFSSDNGAISSIRKNVAIWYSALRNLAIAILLVVLVYIGIRMTISTVAEQEARYKQMLTDWAVSFALVFLLHYIILAGIYVSDSLVELMDVSRESYINQYNSNAKLIKVNDVMNSTLKEALKTASFCKGMGAAIVYTILCGVTFVFLVMYIQRMITIAFLIMISPLITVTYSIDRVKDKKSQALDNWLKEFMVNVLIQPFHCVIYLTISITGMSLMDGSLGGSVVAILMTVFIFKAEKIIKAIFSVVDGGKSSTDMAWGYAIMGAGAGKIESIAKKGLAAMKNKGNNNSGSNNQLEEGNQSKKPTINRQSTNTEKELSNTKGSQLQPSSINGGNNNIQPNNQITGINNDISELQGQIQAADAEGDTMTRDALERQLMKKQVEKSMLMKEGKQETSNNQVTSNNQLNPMPNEFGENENRKSENSYLNNLKNKTKKGVVKNLKWQAKWGARVGGAALGASQGFTGALGTAAATEVATQYVTNKAADKTKELQNIISTKQAEKQFAKAYNQYAELEENKVISNEKMKDITIKYMKGEHDEEMNEADKAYAEYVQDLYNQYKKIGAEDPEQLVVDTVEDVQKKRVTPD